MGRKQRRSNGRALNGIFLLDKPQGISSNAALQHVKRHYKAAKAGHTGSLDPIATGMLPICFGDATKVSAFLLDADKSYEVLCQLGAKTDTGDIEGEIIETADIPTLNEKILVPVLEQFTGPIEQIPPMYSALKHKGQRLYDLARKGIEVERKSRPVTIYAIDIIDISETTFRLRVECSKGTYIRTLVEDIGDVLGCLAHVTELRRLTVGQYSDSGAMITIDNLFKIPAEETEKLDELLLSSDTALSHWPAVFLTSDAAYYLRQGQAVQAADAPSEGMVRVYQGEDEFIGMGKIDDDGKVAPKRIFSAN